MAEGLPEYVDRNGFVLLNFHGGILACGFSHNEIVGFDENVAVVL